MKYAIVDENRCITNIIEVEPDIAAEFSAHYLGNNPLGIGDTYPDEDLTPPVPLTETQIFSQQLTNMQLASIAQGQRQNSPGAGRHRAGAENHRRRIGGVEKCMRTSLIGTGKGTSPMTSLQNMCG